MMARDALLPPKLTTGYWYREFPLPINKYPLPLICDRQAFFEKKFLDSIPQK